MAGFLFWIKKSFFRGGWIFILRLGRLTTELISFRNRALVLGVIPPAQAFFLGNSYLSRSRTENPFTRRSKAAAVPARPAPITTNQSRTSVLIHLGKNHDLHHGTNTFHMAIPAAFAISAMLALS